MIPPLSKLHCRLLFSWFATSAFVFIEPAPFDVLFVINLFYFLLTGTIKIPQVSVYFIGLLSLLFLTSLFSLPLTIMDMTKACSFLAITTYMLVMCVFIGALIGRYGQVVMDILFKGMVFSMVVSLALAIPSMFHILPFHERVTYFGGRFRGFFKDANLLGPTMICLIVYMLFQLKTVAANKIRNYILLALFVLAAILTYSRATWITLIITVLAFYILYSKHKAIKDLLIITPVLLIFLAVTLMLINALGYGDLLAQRLSLQHYDEGRFYVHKFIIEKSFEHPFGIGPGQIEPWIFGTYHYIVGMGSFAAQNTFLRVLMENGYIATAIYIIFTIYCGLVSISLSLRNWQHSGIAAVCSAVLFCYLINSIVIDTLHWRILWIISGVVMGLHILYARYAIQKQQASLQQNAA